MHISRFRIRSFFHNEDLAVRLYEKEAPYMARTTMLTLTGISYTYPSMSEPLFEHVSASFQQGWTAVLGDNGLGKTTVMNALLDSMPEDLPHLIVQQQTGEAALSQTMRRLAALQGKERSQVLAAFAQLNADPDKLLSNEAPSPGELRKLMLCLGILDRPQLIVMDEPTNYLDLESKVALARCLADYPGALVVASHDEWFLDQVVR